VEHEDAALLHKRKAGFEEFYRNLIPALVDFIDKIGIEPAHQVLKQAVQYAPHVGRALERMEVAGEEDRTWLLARLGYFIGEYFAQQHGGCWYVNELAGSRYFGRYVVGRFAGFGNAGLMIDPFHVAHAYVDSPVPRQLEKLLAEVEAELSAGRR
jgi:hypothetical protein